MNIIIVGAGEVGKHLAKSLSTQLHNITLIDHDEKGRSLEGILAFQLHTGPPMEIQFKDLRIKHLPDDLPLLKK